MMSNSSAPHEDNSSAIRQRATPVTTVHDVKQQLETYRLAKAKAYQEEKERIEKKVCASTAKLVNLIALAAN